MSKILWIGDAAVSSGFGRCTERILAEFPDPNDIAILAINYHGDPHPMKNRYRVYPAQHPGTHPLGLGRIRYLLDVERPEIIVIQTNPWNVPPYLKMIRQWSDAPVIGIIAVEGRNPGGHWLKGLDHCIFWTQFGLDEARKGGWEGPSTVIPLGVDLEEFCPGDREEARSVIEIPKDVRDGFIVLNVNRNQHRKRLDLSVIAFAQWVKEYDVRDAFLYLHAMEGSTVQLDVAGLVKYCGIPMRVIHAEPVDVYQGASHRYLLATNQAADVNLSTSLGEGWGLTTMEAMACGVASVATRYSAVPEWAGYAAKLIPIVSEGIMPDVYGQLGGVPSVEHIVAALDKLYRNPDYRNNLGVAGFERVSEPQFRWGNIGKQYLEVIEEVLGGSRGDDEARGSRGVASQVQESPNGATV